MKNDVLVVLGAPNSPSGELSNISKSRLDYCASLYSKGNLVLCTGGWGKHFNTSQEAHAAYAKRNLMTKGILEKDFLEFALSENTVDDAVKIKLIISKLDKVSLKIITSDYHLARVKLIFDIVLSGFEIEYYGAINPLAKQELEPLVNHEHKAIDLIKKNGLYF